VPRILSRLAILALAVLAGLALAAPAAAAPSESSTSATSTIPTGTATSGPRAGSSTRVQGPLVVIGTAGLRWDDLDPDSEALATVLANGSVAALVPRSVELTACPIDGWLAVSAGRRADAERRPDGSCVAPTVASGVPGGPTKVQGWERYRERAAAQGFAAQLGTLGSALTAAGLRTAAIGPGAAVALADGRGLAPAVWPAGREQDGAPPPEEHLADALATRPDLLVIDAGAVQDVAPDADRSTEVAALDARLATILDALPTGATVIIASLADDPSSSVTTATDAQNESVGSAGGRSGARMQLAAIVGVRPGGGMYPGALLHSGSTRQDGLVVTPDLPATVLHLLGLTVPATVDGSPLAPGPTVGTDADRLERLIDLDLAAVTIQPLVTPVLAVAVLIEALAALALALGVRGLPASAAALRRRLLTGLHVVGIAGGCLPAATVLAGLVPWWRAFAPGVALGAAVLVGTVLVAAVALAAPWRRRPLGPAGMVGALTMLVLTADVAAGSPLSLTTVMGGQPLMGGRFYGFGNPLFAVFGAAAVVLTVALADALSDNGSRSGSARTVVVVVGAIGLLAAAIDVAPPLGADVGGAPAVIPAFAVLALRCTRRTVTWRLLGLVGLGTVAAVAAVAVADWLRPAPDRTHLGRFVQTAIDGGAWDVLRRKAIQNMEILISSPMTLLIPVAAALGVWLLMRPERFGLTALRTAYDRLPRLVDGLVALGVMLAIAFATNDSGTSIPPAAGLFAVPVLIAVTARAVADEPASAPSAARPARR